MTATPSKADMDRYTDLILQGFEHDDAVEVIWPPKPEKKPTVMVTEFPDGVIIGWDHCSALNQGCGKPVSKCSCKTGPKELKVFAQWREGSKQMPDYSAAAKQATAKGVPTTDALGAGNAGVVVAVDSPEVDADGEALRRCVIHNELVPEAQADRNDDGTWTCWDCQESGAQRGVQVDG